MLFKQFFEKETCSFTYLLADLQTKEALLIDSIASQVDLYLDFLKKYDLTLLYSIDTHVHADHITGHALLKNKTNSKIIMSAQSEVKCADILISNNEIISCGNIKLKAIYTPGHTSDSYCFLVNDLLFTGDTLMINTTGRTDFQNGDAKDQYNSIFNILQKLPDDLIIYPAHDYNGQTSSKLKEEFANNPRLQVKNEAGYIKMMNELNLSKPKNIDVAVPLNQKCGME
tara:strand:+ start:23074 stop:23757 length:684 start_codon:yes stop_codon:yes gene_type:complete